MDLPRVMPAESAEHYRAGGDNPQGWPFDAVVSSGRPLCRCCGRKIAKGESAFAGYVKWSDTNNEWNSSKVFLHAYACQPDPDSVRVVSLGDY